MTFHTPVYVQFWYDALQNSIGSSDMTIRFVFALLDEPTANCTIMSILPKKLTFRMKFSISLANTLLSKFVVFGDQKIKT